MEPQSIKQGLCLPSYLLTCLPIYVVNMERLYRAAWTGESLVETAGQEEKRRSR